MKILAIDTSSKLCGVCILEDEREIYKLDIITDRSHSIKLMPIIKEVFDKTNLSLSDIDLIVCDKGPGSFTGIRIGVATAKAFSDSLNIPLLGISSLESLAYTHFNREKTVCSIIDAKHNNCYIACYKFSNKMCKTLLEPIALSIDEAIDKLNTLNNSNDTITFIGDGAKTFKDILENNFNAEFEPDDNNLLNSYLLGLAGFKAFEKTNFNTDIPIATSLPMYLKLPQAQQLAQRNVT